LVSWLFASFDCSDATLSVELDPRTLDDRFAAAMAAASVSRASLGVQSFAPHVQQAIGRVQPLGLVRKAVDELRRAGISSINFDLMYGLPQQSAADLEETLRATIEMMPGRIALFGYAHVPHLIPRQRRIDDSRLAGAEERFAQAQLGHAILTDAGYEPVGFDHFARPDDPLAVAQRDGTLRRNFQGFTDDQSRVLLGFGASAISDFPDRIVQNEKNAGRYRMLASSGQLPAARGLVRSSEDIVRGRIIEDLLCRGEADISALCLGTVRERLRPFRERGLVTLGEDRVQLRPGALPYARAIAAAFDTYRQPHAGRFSNAI
jgi:oxygen-independent coproporphyrinogen-3 oxidase